MAQMYHHFRVFLVSTMVKQAKFQVSMVYQHDVMKALNATIEVVVE
jgi:hypothetical protein